MECKEQDSGNNKDKTGPADTLQIPVGGMLSVECQGEEDGGKNKDNAGPAEQLKVPSAVQPNF